MFNEETIRVWDVEDPSWTATINNGSGGMGKIVNAEFGRTKMEVLVFSDFGSKMTIWSLTTGRHVEIRDPKYSSSRGHEYRKKLGIFVLLTRPGAQDMLSLHAPNSYKVLKSVALPTMDVQGMKWSPDENWVAVWDTSSMGQKVYIYTADGNLYRSYTGTDDFGIGSSGIRTVEWSTAGQYLAIGGTDRRVTLLSTQTFSPVIYLDHTATIQLSEGGQIWQEQVTGASKRSYQAIPQPYAPPTSSVSGHTGPTRSGISTISFNSSGTMAATKDDSTPTAVWIWNLSSRVASTIIIHHSPVRQLAWHPNRPELLLINCALDEVVLHMWNCNKMEPEVTPLSSHKTIGKLDIRWLGNCSATGTAILISDNQKALVVWPEGKHMSTRSKRQAEDGDESLDSVYEALVGQSAKKEEPIDSTELLVSSIAEDISDTVEDTFIGRKQFELVT
jgi:WD40 repeat protein